MQKPVQQDMKKVYRKLFWLIPGPLFYVLFLLSSLWPDLTETVYSRGIFVFINQGLSTVTGLLPFSLAEVLLYIFLLFVVVSVILMAVRSAAAGKSWWLALLNRFLTLLCVFSLVYTLFAGLWGFNYSRNTLGETLGLDTSTATVDELYATCEALIERANDLRDSVPEDESGLFSPGFSKQDMMENITYYYSMAANATGHGFLGGSYGRAKPVLYSTGLSYANITG
ncbi:MAG: DUF3810 family protein, partial [Eubacteriales bacterium]|nr:DUF3810 family protein [Eubacteriales bacterium]